MKKWGPLSLLVLFGLSLTLTACWIPLPKETAIVVQVMEGADPKGIPVDGVQIRVDGTTLVTGVRNTGQVFKSLSVGGVHTVQVDPASLLDPQGGRGWVIRGSHISGESAEGTYQAYADRGFAVGDTTMAVPVADGFITVVTVYRDVLQVSPVDNQWLTDGRDTSSPYRAGDTDEFASTILPTFRWRQEPSLTGTVGFIFQLWQDTDGDTRFPLGIRDASGYTNTLPGIKPDWEVPLAGLQGARAAGTGRTILWSSRTDGYPADAYDLYYAPTASWNNVDWGKNLVVRGIQWAPAGGALFFTVGPGAPYPNDTLLLKNGTGYTFGLRARDASANLDTLSATSTRNVTPVSGGTSLGSASISSTIATDVGGELSFVLDNSLNSGTILHHVYAAPSAAETYDPRYIRKDVSYTGSPVPVTLTGLVNGTNYYIGVEPFAANGDVGIAGTPISAVPAVPVGSTSGPSWIVTNFTISPGTPGTVLASWGTAAASSTITYRLYHAPGSVAASDAGAYASGTYAFIDTTGTSATVGDMVNDVSYGFAVVAIDSAGNGSSLLTTTVTLPGSGGPVWDTGSPSIFFSVRWSSGSTVYPLGWTYRYDGFPLGQDPAATPPEGEYVWRVIQDNGEPAAHIDGKLGAFYTYNGYYYSSTASGALQMTGPSSNVNHHRVFSFMEAGIPPLNLASDIMGSPLDSSATPNNSYQQRPASDFAGLLESGTDPDQVNQMVIRYQTNRYGEAVFSKNIGGDFLGILKISTMNRATNLASKPPYLQYKDFLETYNHTNGDLVDFPSAIYPLVFSGDLADPDYQNPDLAP